MDANPSYRLAQVADAGDYDVGDELDPADILDSFLIAAVGAEDAIRLGYRLHGVQLPNFEDEL